MTFDEYRESISPRRIDFIKLDVDGFEVEVLRGGKKTLKTHNPSICMELSPYVLQERGDSFAALFEILRERGYQFVDLKGQSSITDSQGKLKTRIPDGAGINVFAVADTRLIDGKIS